MRNELPVRADLERETFQHSRKRTGMSGSDSNSSDRPEKNLDESCLAVLFKPLNAGWPLTTPFASAETPRVKLVRLWVCSYECHSLQTYLSFLLLNEGLEFLVWRGHTRPLNEEPAAGPTHVGSAQTAAETETAKPQRHNDLLSLRKPLP